MDRLKNIIKISKNYFIFDKFFDFFLKLMIFLNFFFHSVNFISSSTDNSFFLFSYGSSFFAINEFKNICNKF
jgi:hypothetical protein